MNENMVRAAIGFACKAGKCFTGDYACKSMLTSGKAKYLVINTEASGNTTERFTRLCEEAGVPLLQVDFDVGDLTGRYGCKVLVITGKAFADMVKKALNSQQLGIGESI